MGLRALVTCLFLVVILLVALVSLSRYHVAYFLAGCLFSSYCLRPGRYHGCPVLPTYLCAVGLAWHMEQAGTAF